MMDAQHIAARVHALTARVADFTGLVVAFSGGRDSSVLLALLAKANIAPVRAVNVDHGLQPDVADQWHAHNVRFCADHRVPLTRIIADTRIDDGDSVEAAARKARYAALAKAARAGELVLLAQHEADQAETLMLQLLRGAGPTGLASMPAVATLGDTLMARPLLDVASADIETYAQQHGVQWFTDPSNSDERFDRNFLRTSVLPMLRQRWPSMDQTLARSARWQAESADLQRQLGAADVRSIEIEKGVLSCRLLARAPVARQRNAMRFAIRAAGLTTPPALRLEAVLGLALQATERGSVRWDGGIALRYRDQLHLLDDLPSDPAGHWSAVLTPDVSVRLPQSLGSLSLLAAPADVRLTVRFREGGERVPIADGQHQSLAKWFQQRGIPPWRRSRTPLVFAGDLLVAVGTQTLPTWSGVAASARLHWDSEIVS